MDDDVEAVEREFTRALRAWTVASTLTGAVAVVAGRRRGHPALRAFGQQTVLWAAVDAAVLGIGATVKARTSGPPPAERLRLLLTANAVADVGYVVIGSALASRPDRVPRRLRRRKHGRRTSEAELRAHGLAVVVQGLALLVLDTRAARKLGAITR